MHLKELTKYCILPIILSISMQIHANTSDSDTSYVNSILKTSKIALDSNQRSKSLQLAREAYNQSSRLKFTLGIAASTELIARTQSVSGAKDSSLATYKRSLNFFKNINDKPSIARVLYSIGEVYSETGNQDSAEIYAKDALKLFQDINDRIGIVKSYNILGSTYFFRADYSKSLEYFFISLSQQEQLTDKSFKSVTLNNIGAIFKSQGNYPKALNYFFQSLKIQEELKAYRNIALINNNIGLIYQQLKDTSESLKYYKVSLENCQHIGDSSAMSYTMMGLAEIYRIRKEYKQAFDYFKEIEKIRIKYSNYLGLADLYVNMSRVYNEMSDYQKSLTSLLKAISIYDKINAPMGKANALIGIGEVYFKQGLIQLSVENCKAGIELAKKIGAIEVLKDGYSILNTIYEKTGDNIQAYRYYKLFIEYRDSIGGIQNAKELQRIKFESEYNSLFNKEKLENENKLNLAENKTIKQTKIANTFLLAFVITLFGFVLIFLNYRQKQKRNNLLAFQKLDMERQKAELTVQRDELEIQKNLVIHQRDKIMTMLTDLGESIDYARKIQQALLPSDKTLACLLGEYFLFFQPRESVGGDFYWVYQNEDLVYFAVGDCTGHGVPGGFMSMLGVSLLNEQVSRGENITPAKMLWGLRDMIVKALNQTGLDEDSQDGMDIALCTLNKRTRELVYSGANISLFLTTEFPPQASELVYVQENIVEFKPDRMPVSFYLRMNDFNERKIQLNQGDCIYLTSDGFADQFGGPSNKKFGYNTLRNLLLSVSFKPIDKQRDILWNEFDKWKGEENQTDDVIVLGIKIS